MCSQETDHPVSETDHGLRYVLSDPRGRLSGFSVVFTQDGDTEAFAVNTSVLQGDTLAPFLFIVVLDYVLRQAMCNLKLRVTLQPRRGLSPSREYFTNLDFADDIALVSETVKNAQILLQKLETAAATVKLTVNQSKTKTVITNDKRTEQHITRNLS